MILASHHQKGQQDLTPTAPPGGLRPSNKTSEMMIIELKDRIDLTEGRIGGTMKPRKLRQTTELQRNGKHTPKSRQNKTKEWGAPEGQQRGREEKYS